MKTQPELNTIFQQMAKDKSHAKQTFSKAFSNAGFSFHEPDILIPSHDTSTLFTGSTISTFKPYLQENNEYRLKPMYTIQNCLRTQNSMKILQAEHYPKWSSLFCSVGAIGRYQDRYSITHALLNFLEHLSLKDVTRLRINIASTDHDLIEVFENEKLIQYLNFDSQPPNYYQHKFGMEYITGRNCNLAVSCDNGEFMDIGNLIVIEKSHVPIAVEVALGIETVVTRMHGLCSSIMALSTAESFSRWTVEELYIIDALAACIAIMSLNIRPIADNRGRILRRYLQGLNMLRLKEKMSIEFIVNIARQFEITHFKSRNSHTELSEYLHHHTKIMQDTKVPSEINKYISRCLYK